MSQLKTGVVWKCVAMICILGIGVSAFAGEERDFMSLSLEEILNMEVTTVSKFAERLFDAPGVITVVTKDELDRFGGTTLKDILERVPSLIGSTVYMTDRSMIAARGDQVLASSSHVLLLINGRPVRESLEGGIKSEMYEAFPVNIIEKIEVVRGPGSVLYGSNAISAVINVITESAGQNEFAVTGIAGQAGAYGTQAKAKWQAGDLSVVASGRFMRKADWETDFSYNNIYTPVDTTVTVKNTIPNEGMGTYVGISYKNLSLMGSYNAWKNHYWVADYATIFPFPTFGVNNWSKSFADLGYKLRVSDQWDMNFNVTYNRSTFDTEAWPNTNRDSYEVVAEWSNYYNPTEKMGLVFGGLYNYFSGEEWGPGFTFTDANRFSVGAFAQVNYRLLRSVNVITGVQANKVEDIDLDIVPRLGMIWNPVARINFKALYSSAFRAPSINELSINFPEMRGNPNLTPEKVTTLDLGMNYQGEQIQAGVNFFHTQQKDVIFQNRDLSVVPAPMYWNGVEVDFMGVELEGKYYVNRNLFLTGSMLYQTNEDKGGIENVTPIANFGAKGGVSYKCDRGYTISLFHIHQGGLDEKFDTQVNPAPGAYNLLSLYARADVNRLFSWEKKPAFSLFLQVDNLLDEVIWLPDWGLLMGKSIPVNPGRAIYAGLNITL
ncbi:MAG TPA: TonB-dependent receptor [bacterium]|nr:TonB-dependent receptor [bacterium]